MRSTKNLAASFAFLAVTFICWPAVGASEDAALTQVMAKSPDYYKVDPASVKISVTPLDEYPEDRQFPYPSVPEAPVAPGSGDLLILDQVVNVTAKIWDVIQKNKPVVNIATQYATAVPKGIRSWTRLTGWKGPKRFLFQYSCMNPFGVTTIDAKWLVMYNYNGSYKDKGKYLTAVTVEPIQVNAVWLWNISIAAEVPDSSVINVGTVESPVAGLNLIFKYSISTNVASHSYRSIYHIRGDGSFKVLADTSDNGMEPLGIDLSKTKSVGGLLEKYAVPMPPAP